MKKLFLLFTVLFLSICTRPVSADMGPKPSVTISFQNAPDHPYYVTLLSTQEFYGPWGPLSEEEIANQEEELRPAYEAFQDYAERNGLYFLNYVQECSENDQFKWSYYPPETFRIAVYDAVSKTLKVSDTCKREAFYTYYNVDLNTGELLPENDPHLSPYLLSFALRMILTIMIEVFIALLFGYKEKKEIKTIIIANIVTQLLLNVIMLFLDYYSGMLVWLFVFPALELGVFLTELLVYLFLFKNHKKLKTFFYTLIANGLTFLLGLYLAVVTAAF